MPGIGIGLGLALGGGGGGAALSADKSTFLTSVAAGALIASLSAPFGAGTTYETFGAVPGQLALSGGKINAGAAAAVAGTSYAIGVLAVSADGKRKAGETLTFAAQAGTPAPGPNVIPLTKFATALAAVKANTADAIVVDLGDSTRAGVAYGEPPNAPVAPFTNGARDFTISANIASRSREKGLKVSQDAFFGWNLQDSSTVAHYNAYNPHVQVDATWAPGTAQTLGGPMFRKASATAGAIVFTTVETCSSFDVWVANNSGSYIFRVDGVQVATYVATGTNALVKVTVAAGSEAIHSLSIDTATAATANLAGVIARSATKRLIVINAGWRGSTSTDLNNKAVNTTSAYKTPVALPQIQPSLTILSVGINDARTNGGGTTPAAFASNLSDLAGYAVQNGSLILSTPSNISPANDGGSGVTMSGVYGAYSSLAQAGPYNLSDTVGLIGDYATLNAAGRMNADGLHIIARAAAVTIGTSLANLAFDGAVAGGYVA